MSRSLVLTLLHAFAISGPLSTALPRSSVAPRTELSYPCSRPKSRTVRQRFNQRVKKLKGMDRSNVSLDWPNRCPFNPLQDLFGWHEMNKTRGRRGTREWECIYSGKAFSSEHYVDLHMERKYMKEVPDNGTCLADYCQVFEYCNVNEPSLVESFSSEPPPCDPQELDRLKKMCHDVIDRCVPAGDAEKPELNSQLHQIWCEQLTCEAKADRHFQVRRWHIIGTGTLCVLLSIIGLCVCMASKDDPDLERMQREALNRKRMAASRQVPKSGNDNSIDALRNRRRGPGQGSMARPQHVEDDIIHDMPVDIMPGKAKKNI